ncbi:MAG: hypothetical protein R6X25_02065 [Candidatus Krumholzibacteriia bacterium]
MACCHDMRKGEIYVCTDCGMELEVVRECHDTVEDCGCKNQEGRCALVCCGHELSKKVE